MAYAGTEALHRRSIAPQGPAASGSISRPNVFAKRSGARRCGDFPSSSLGELSRKGARERYGTQTLGMPSLPKNECAACRFLRLLSLDRRAASSTGDRAVPDDSAISVFTAVSEHVRPDDIYAAPTDHLKIENS